GPHARLAQPRRSSGARRVCSCPRIAADEKRDSMASFRLFAGSELSLGTVLASAISESWKSSRGAERAVRCLVDDIGERDAAYWPKPSHGVANRQQGIRLDAGRHRPLLLSRTER